jgi:hypothetical protein
MAPKWPIDPGIINFDVEMGNVLPGKNIIATIGSIFSILFRISSSIECHGC